MLWYWQQSNASRHEQTSVPAFKHLREYLNNPQKAQSYINLVSHYFCCFNFFFCVVVGLTVAEEMEINVASL